MSYIVCYRHCLPISTTCAPPLHVCLLLAVVEAEVAADGGGLGLLLDLGRTLRLALDPLRTRRIRARCFARHAAAFQPTVRAGATHGAVSFPLAVAAAVAHQAVVFHLTVGARVARRAPLFQLAVRAGVAHHALVFPLAVRAGVAHHALVFPLAVGAGVARRAVLFQLAVRAS